MAKGDNMSKHKSLIGRKFGMLTVLDEVPPDKEIYGKYSGRRLIVECTCGRKKSVNKRSVIRGRTKSCGCLQKATATTHGLSHTRAYRIWMAMKQRCCSKKHWLYPRYGGRGIFICEEWKNDVAIFCEWAAKNGCKKGLTIERKDNDGNYEPSNCKFVTIRENLNNTSKTVFLYVDGEKISLQNASLKYGINSAAISQRIKKLHWSDNNAVKVPLRYHKCQEKRAMA